MGCVCVESDVHAQGARPQSAPPSKNRSVLSAARGDGRGDQSGSSAESGCAASSNGNHSITSSDVSERLLARGREAQKRKHQLLKEREEEEARNMKRAVPTSRGTEIIASQNEGIRWEGRPTVFILNAEVCVSVVYIQTNLP